MSNSVQSTGTEIKIPPITDPSKSNPNNSISNGKTPTPLQNPSEFDQTPTQHLHSSLSPQPQVIPLDDCNSNDGEPSLSTELQILATTPRSDAINSKHLQQSPSQQLVQLPPPSNISESISTIHHSQQQQNSHHDNNIQLTSQHNYNPSSATKRSFFQSLESVSTTLLSPPQHNHHQTQIKSNIPPNNHNSSQVAPSNNQSQHHVSPNNYELNQSTLQSQTTLISPLSQQQPSQPNNQSHQQQRKTTASSITPTSLSSTIIGNTSTQPNSISNIHNSTNTNTTTNIPDLNTLDGIEDTQDGYQFVDRTSLSTQTKRQAVISPSTTTTQLQSLPTSTTTILPLSTTTTTINPITSTTLPSTTSTTTTLPSTGLSTGLTPRLLTTPAPNFNQKSAPTAAFSLYTPPPHLNPSLHNNLRPQSNTGTNHLHNGSNLVPTSSTQSNSTTSSTTTLLNQNNNNMIPNSTIRPLTSPFMTNPLSSNRTTTSTQTIPIHLQQSQQQQQQQNEQQKVLGSNSSHLTLPPSMVPNTTSTLQNSISLGGKLPPHISNSNSSFNAPALPHHPSQLGLLHQQSNLTNSNNNNNHQTTNNNINNSTTQLSTNINLNSTLTPRLNQLGFTSDSPAAHTSTLSTLFQRPASSSSTTSTSLINNNQTQQTNSLFNPLRPFSGSTPSVSTPHATSFNPHHKSTLLGLPTSTTSTPLFDKNNNQLQSSSSNRLFNPTSQQSFSGSLLGSNLQRPTTASIQQSTAVSIQQAASLLGHNKYPTTSIHSHNLHNNNNNTNNNNVNFPLHHPLSNNNNNMNSLHNLHSPLYEPKDPSSLSSSSSSSSSTTTSTSTTPSTTTTTTTTTTSTTTTTRPTTRAQTSNKTNKKKTKNKEHDEMFEQLLIANANITARQDYNNNDDGNNNTNSQHNTTTNDDPNYVPAYQRKPPIHVPLQHVVCEVCFIVLKPKDLPNHQRCHTLYNFPTTQYFCHECKMGFFSISGLNGHKSSRQTSHGKQKANGFPKKND